MQIVLFLIFILLVLLVVVSKKNSFSKNAKISITIVVAVFAVAIYFYESSLENNAEYNREMVNAFRQGKTLTCKEYKVNKDKFLYVSGTQTFVPKASETTLEGVIVKVSTCKDN
jgi:predicted ferric reductase